MYKKIIEKIRSIYGTEGVIPLHEPRFIGNERKYVLDTIDSSFVSSVGEYVTRFEKDFANYVGLKYAVATVNGTAALQISLMLAGVNSGDEVLTQAITFVATGNAILYRNAKPVFLDVDKNTLGLSPEALKEFLTSKCEMRNDGFTYNQESGNKISACLPVHIFGHPVKIDLISEICKKWNISLIEDVAEALGSKYKGKHLGTFGKISAFSFNGNKIITTGGGGMIVTDDEIIAKKAKHLTTTAKLAHTWEYFHDDLGYNFRLPNINAALGCAQLEKVEDFVENKRRVAQEYANFFEKIGLEFFKEPEDSRSNYWLNSILFSSENERNDFLKISNENGVMTRPIWSLLYKMPMFSGFQKEELPNSLMIEKLLVNIPSSVILK